MCDDCILKKKDQKLNEAKGLTKAELSAIRGAAKMKRKMENPRAKISPEKTKQQDRKTKSEVKKKAIETYKSMAANMGDYDAQWRESERNNSAHASKDNIEKFMRLAKQEFDAARKAKPDMDEYRKNYFKHQERMKTLEGMMGRVKKKIDEQSFLTHVPRRYLDKFPGVKKDPQKAAQYDRERRRKADIAQHYYSHHDHPIDWSKK